MEQKKKIKILQIVGNMNNGGVEAFVLSYYHELHDLCEFTFMCFDGSHHIPEEEIKSLGGKIVIVPHIKHLHAFNKALDKHLKENKYDIIHSHLNTLSVFPLRIAKKNKCPIRIAHSHSASNKKEFKRHLAKSILRLFSRKYANVYYACSEVAGRFQFGNKAFDKGLVEIVINGVDLNKYKFNLEARNSIRNALNLQENDYVVGNVGRFVGTKNQQYILKIAAKCPDKKFLLLGSGELEETYKKEIADKHLNNVILRVTNESIVDYYSAFDMFAFPSLYEGLGLVMLEAESNGLYVVCSNFVPSVTLLTGYGKYLPINDEDIDKWVEEINKAQPRQDLVYKIKEAGYDIEDSAIGLYEKYQNLIKEK